MQNLQKKYHKTLLTVLNNIGIIGSLLAGIADIIFVIIFIIGVDVNISMTTSIIFASVNALIGLLINILFRYQGVKYAEIENEELVEQYYQKKAETNKEPLSIGMWQLIQGVKDFFIKGATTTFFIFGIIHITIQGSKNPIQLLITLVSLVLFGCFGLISMNNSYDRYYNIQVPYMQLKIKEREDKEIEQCQSLKTETNIEQSTNN